MILLSSFTAFGQFETNVNATGKHKYLLGAPKRTKAQIKARKQQLQSYKAYLDIRKEFDQKFDSTKVIYLDSIYMQNGYDISFKTDSLWSGLPDSLVYEFKKTPDSVWVAQKVIVSGDLPPEAVRMLTNPPRKPSVKQLKAQIEDRKRYLKIRKEYNKAYLEKKGYYLDSIYMQKQIPFTLKKDPDWSDLPDSVSYSYKKSDSLWISQKVLANGDFPPEAVHYLTSPPPDPKKLLLEQVDSTKYNYSVEDLENINDFMDTDLPLDGQAAPGLTDAFGGGAKNPNVLLAANIIDQLTMIDPKEFSKQQAKDKVLKRKYMELPDKRKPEDGVKRNSLENSSFRERIYIGGNLNVTSTDPLVIDFSFQLGYWLKKNWLAGTGISFQNQFTRRKHTAPNDSWGRSLFTRYSLPHDFLLYSEFEQKINESLFNETETDIPVRWQEAWLAGAGREFKIGIVRMQLLLLYDFTWRTNDLYSRPFITKLGFQFTRQPRIGR